MFGRSQDSKNRALRNALEDGDLAETRRALEKGADAKAVFTDYMNRTPLHYASVIRDAADAEEAVSLLLSLGANPNLKDDYNTTPLECALTESRGNVGVVRRLLEAGADATGGAGGAARKSALTLAFENRAWEAAEYLMEARPDLGLAKGDPVPPLALAMSRGAPRPLVDKLLAARVDVNLEGGGNSALLAAASTGNNDYVALLLAQPGIKVDGGDEAGRTPLLAAAAAGSDAVVEALLRAGADMNKGARDDGSPLTNAIRNDREIIALALLDAGATTRYADRDGRTALVLAAERNKDDLVKALLDARQKEAGQNATNPNVANPNGVKTPANGASASSSPWNGAKSVAPADDLLAALFAALEKGSSRLLETILAAGPDLHGTDSDGFTPLTRAASQGKVEVLTVLLKAGANPEEADLRGKSAYQSTESWQCEDAKKFLARYRRQLERKPVAPPAPAEPERFRRLAPDMLEVNQGGLKTVFNFWTQQVIVSRGAANDAPLVVQNFADVQRQEAITEAWHKLKELGGDPPETPETSLQKKTAGLGKG